MNKYSALHFKGRYSYWYGACILRWGRFESVTAAFLALPSRPYCLRVIRWNQAQQSGVNNDQERVVGNPHGFGALSRRHTSSKPIIAAVNGNAYGGGTEMILNCDIVIASEEATFQLPEVKRGVVAIQGGLPTPATLARSN
jgi:hypothetical protein